MPVSLVNAGSISDNSPEFSVLVVVARRKAYWPEHKSLIGRKIKQLNGVSFSIWGDANG